MRKLRRVLVANRGEIAVRVLRTLRELGIESVAVYSDADAESLHVRLADRAMPIGPPVARESYLAIEKLLAAAKSVGADAIHPGYGFLSENPDFADACDGAGIVFIGPPGSAMRQMGNKVRARERMRAAGVPTVPGVESADKAALIAAASTLGMPVLVKAAAGGGGKGMRRVDRIEDLAPALERAQSEAERAFGDGTVYVERKVDAARHVEVQVLADGHGNTVHLFERDCSIQRRHQKIVEETPCPAGSADLVARMGEVAVRAARAVDYRGAGTIEFLLTPSGEFYFLEMNTRLQVEHPITELITGLDLVAEQVRIAAGEPMSQRAQNAERAGAAIECRIYAEDPARGFLPSPGRVTDLRVPAGPGVRDDSGIYAGWNVPTFYDPLLSKLSVWGSDRPAALARMRRALAEYLVAGIRTNLDFHRRLFLHPAFLEGRYDTEFVDREKAALCRTDPSESDPAFAAVGVALATAANAHPAATAVTRSMWRWGDRGGFSRR